MKRKILVSLLCFVLFFNSFSIHVYAKEDYLSITLADIVITYFNATGVAIGETELFNGIQQLWGNVTLNDLVDNDVLVAEGVNWTKDDIKNMIGYGNLSIPFVKVNQRNLKNYLGEVPISNVAHDALEAMFAFDSPVTDGIFTALAVILGDVANIGRMGYDLVSDVVLGFTDIFPISTLKQAYQKFTDSTYFQDLLENSTIGSTPGTDYKDIKLQYPDYCFDNYEDWGYIITSASSNNIHYFYEGPNVYGVAINDSTHGNRYNCLINIGDDWSTGADWSVSNLINGDTILNQYLNPRDIYNNQWMWGSYGKNEIVQYGGRCFYMETDHQPSFAEVKVFVESCLGQEGSGTGITNYINNQVGNIASDNYINLSPNIGTKEYINIFDRIAYIENLNQIENNTDNGNYSQNSTVINNYNNQYIQNNIPNARPSTVPAQNPEEQPAQPFVSPRPTQAPEFVESVVQEGGLSSEITNKFPFCIPWDIKALIDNLWAPEARAPYIHWDAEFGSWGKLGEVDIDLSEYDDVAKIFRSTTLLLWIVGLIVITRNLIG